MTNPPPLPLSLFLGAGSGVFFLLSYEGDFSTSGVRKFSMSSSSAYSGMQSGLNSKSSLSWSSSTHSSIPGEGGSMVP